MNCKECNNYEPKDDPKDDTKWIRIDYDVIPEELFKKYGVKPFEIMQDKMRKDGKVWNKITYFEAIKVAKEMGYRLVNIREILLLLEHYKNTNKDISSRDKEFLDIKELSYEDSVNYEWIYVLPSVAALRGGSWSGVADAGVFDLSLDDAPSGSSPSIGFRCCK